MSLRHYPPRPPVPAVFVQDTAPAPLPGTLWLDLSEPGTSANTTIREVSTDDRLSVSDAHLWVSGTTTITLPPAAGMANFVTRIANVGAGTVSLVVDGGGLIYTGTSSTATETVAAGTASVLGCNGTVWRVLD